MDYRVEWHSERGETSVCVREDHVDRDRPDNIVWDCSGEELAQLVEDGFINCGAMMGYDGPRVDRDKADASVLAYVEELGLI